MVRIAPNEVHLSDPNNYDKIYNVTGKFYKDPAFYDVLGNQWSFFSIASNELHRQRRAPLNPFFSRRTVFELEDIVQDKVAKLCRIIQGGIEKGVPVDLHAGFRAISVDVVTDYAFDDCWDQLDQEDLGAWYTAAGLNSGITFTAMQQFPFLMPVMKALPSSVVRQLSPQVAALLGCMDVS